MNTSCALGFFDGVHLAHAAILRSAARYASEHGQKSAAVTFDSSPAEFFGREASRLTTKKQKEELIYSLGIDEIYYLKADRATLSLSPEAFFEKYILETFSAKALFCGFNYSFGDKASGKTAHLSALCKSHGIFLSVLDELKVGGVTVSSSSIRDALRQGNIELANSLLGRPFEARGTVAKGKELGRALSFPTANIYPPRSFPRLARGVYATRTTVDGVSYPSVTNVGINPTVHDDNYRIETNISGFDSDIYGKEISVLFYHHQRGEIEFPSVKLLGEQIERDKAAALEYINGI